jgi:hypothetical protein
LRETSQNSLRSLVMEIWGEILAASIEEMPTVVEKVVELLGMDPSGKRDFFYKRMKRLFFVMTETRPEDLDD